MHFKTTGQSKRDCDNVLTAYEEQGTVPKRVLMNDDNAYSLFLVRCNVPQVYDGSAFCDSQSLTDASHSGLCHAVQRRNPLHSDRVLSGHVFLTKPCQSTVACVAICDENRPLFQSINYYQNTKVCELITRQQILAQRT